MAKKKTTNKKSSGGKIKSRPKPLVPRAGIKSTRYEDGGKLHK